MSSNAVWEAQADFALNVLRASNNDGGNTFLSPVSISVALAMTYSGADGKTKAEMNQVLAKGASDAQFHAAFEQLVTLLNAPNECYRLCAANRVYVHEAIALKDAATGILNKHYATQLVKVDFVSNAAATTNDINKWVESQTNDRIKNLLVDGALDAMTRMVLVNAIYFKGDWREQFKEAKTNKQPFYVANGAEKQVDMMHQTETFSYVHTDKVQVLGLPYVGGNLAMYIILPNERMRLDDVISSMTGKQLLDTINDARELLVQVSLPKFRMEKSLDLAETLQTLGIKDAFDAAAADFSNFSDASDEKLFISKVVHKAFLEVNEAGTEAAAATAVMMNRMCMMLPTEPAATFNCDHPFMIVLTAEKKHLLFVGRVDQPL